MFGSFGASSAGVGAQDSDRLREMRYTVVQSLDVMVRILLFGGPGSQDYKSLAVMTKVSLPRTYLPLPNPTVKVSDSVEAIISSKIRLSDGSNCLIP